MAKLELRNQRIFDYLSNYRFHVIDVTFGSPSVLNISYGFARASIPEVSVEMKEVKEGNLEQKHYIPMASTVSPITLERGVVIFNSDFNDWTRAVIKGVPNQRRNLMLVQYSDVSLVGGADTGNTPIASNIANQIFNINDLFGRVPGRIWMLHSCMPTAYKAGSDLDALGNEISIASLTIQPQFINEIALGIF